MKGGKLSAQNLKGLLDASYDSKVDRVGEFEIDRGLSSKTSKVYRNPGTGQVVVAHRGTAGITDWGNNAVYALGGKQAYKLTPRFKEAEKVQRRAEKKYGASNVSTIGHSQGGLQSELLGGRSKEIITLNKATLPFESNKNKNQYDVRSERDVVSGLNPFQKKSKKDVKIKSKTFNPLTEHSGDVLDRLDKNQTIGQGIYLKGYSRIRGGMLVTPDSNIETRARMLVGAYDRLVRLVDRKLAGDITEDQRETLLNTKAYAVTLRPKVMLVRRQGGMTQLLMDYLAELRDDADNFLPVKKIEDWRDSVLGAELIQEGMPVGRLF